MSPVTEIHMNRPRFTPRAAEKFALDSFGVRTRAVALPSERDQNFHLREESGRQFVLKIASSADSREVLDFQNRALFHVAQACPSLLFPRLCRTTTNEEIAWAPGEGSSIHCLRLLTYVPGRLLAEVRSHTPALLQSVGRLFASIDLALSSFSHPASRRELKWDLRRAGTVIGAGLPSMRDRSRRALLKRWLADFEREVEPEMGHLRTSVVHNDGNDHNVLVSGRGADLRASGVIDFGDMLHGVMLGDLAIACAYMIMGKKNPLAAICRVVEGYHGAVPLAEREIGVLFPLIAIRLATSVAVSAVQQRHEPENRYLSVSEDAAWQALERLAAIHPRFAHCALRDACGWAPSPRGVRLARWLSQNRASAHPIVPCDLKGPESLVLDLSVGSKSAGDFPVMAEPEKFAACIFEQMRSARARVGIGRYDEARGVYTGDAFKIDGDEAPESRTVHLGLDLFMEPGSPVFAPWGGKVHSFRNNARPLDYGPTIILEHRTGPSGDRFFTLYGHLSRDSLRGLKVGKVVRKGSRIGWIGDLRINGGWPPHVHFQVVSDIFEMRGDFPGVAAPSARNVWLGLCPDPGLLLGVPDSSVERRGPGASEILELRRSRIARNLSLSYRNPLHIVRGYGQYLYDGEGRPYLDAVNNVPHVGHCNPRVVRAAREQIGILNTNTRYLHENLVRYAERLCATLPEPLRVCFFVCSGSEANDLALRLARTHTRERDVIVVEGGYHGNSSALIDVSPYKFEGPGGQGRSPHVWKLPMPDPYRGIYKAVDPKCGAKFAEHARLAVETIRASGRVPAAFLCESALGCGGQIILPQGYLSAVYTHVRKGGGVCIADEVQVGFGRLGAHFWGFESHGVVPEIVTMGKPIGNGHPLAAVVTTPEIAASFDNGMEYFNTFGGNPVSCAIGIAVLDVLAEERLQENALRVGSRLKEGLESLKRKHPLIGDVRSLGLFLGVELVRDPETLEPASEEASYTVERMKDLGVLTSADGPFHNVIKIKPPMVFDEANADTLVATLDRALCELSRDP